MRRGRAQRSPNAEGAALRAALFDIRILNLLLQTQVARYVFTDDVKLQIDVITYFDLLEVGMLIGVRNNANRKTTYLRIDNR